ncbi:MAG: tetratricopeptide repeat protein [Isosphaeraceae bacterium]
MTHPSRRVGIAFVLTASAIGNAADAADGHSSQSGHGQSSRSVALGAAAGGYSNYAFPFWSTIGPDGIPVVFAPLPPVVGTVLVPVATRAGSPLAGPMPPPAPAVRANAPDAEAARAADLQKGRKLATIGDRLFRAGNVKRAEERYQQAARSAPNEAAPLLRLAQVAVVRGMYSEAASRLRQSVDAEPGWVTRAPNILSIYGEPRDFERQISRLESHILVEPNDRDAWLVLGAQLYLNGQTRRAGDIFLRLTDRRPDPTLAAFLDATRVRGK